VTNEIVPYRGGRFYFTAGKADRRGVELGAALLGANDLEVTGSLTMSRNRYIEYTVDSVHYGRPGKFADYADNDIAGVPSVFYAASIARGLGDNIPFKLQLGLRGVGEYFIDDANAIQVPGYHTWSATASTANGVVVGGVTLKAFFSVENLTDRRYIGSAFVNPDFVNDVPVAFEPGSARSYIVSISVGPAP
jgi:outer membrane receptor protein involved in Fe transport